MIRIAITDASRDDTDESVTVAEAARRLGCGSSTVRALILTGELTGHRVGKCGNPRGVRVHVAAIRQYKARHTLGNAPPPAASLSQNSTAIEARRRLRALGVL
jgi:excisionase family DNA binding protein